MSVVLIGAGGHAKVVFEAMVASGLDVSSISVRANSPASFMGISVETPECKLDMRGFECHVAIGNNTVRYNLMKRVVQAGGDLLTIVHPRSVVSTSARISNGALIAANACVAAMARIGSGVIANHGAIIDHDCVVGDASHIAPGAVLGGGVRVGSRVLIGSNATVLPGIEISDDAVVGAASIVTKDVPFGQIWIGNTLAIRG